MRIIVAGAAAIVAFRPGPSLAQGFNEVGEAVGLAKPPWPTQDVIGGGASMVDLDGDGRLDLVVTLTGTPALYRQSSGGTFVDRSDALGIEGDFNAVGHLAFDMDGDGDPDLLVLGRTRNVLLRNDGGLAFVDVSSTHLPGRVAWSAAAAPGDIDADGDLDVFVTGYIRDFDFPKHICAGNQLLINDGFGRFEDRAAEYGVAGRGCGLGAVMADIDGDNDLDILVANDFGPMAGANQAFRNDGPSADGGLIFTEVSGANGWGEALYGMGVAAGDLNDDGSTDFFVTSIGRPALLVSTPSGGWVDRTVELGADVVWGRHGYEVAWGAAMEDFDGDGWLDLLAAGGYLPGADFLYGGEDEPNVVLKGGPEGFEKDPAGWGFGAVGAGRGLAAGDYDGDGRTDVAVALTSGGVALYHNGWTGRPPPLRVTLIASETAPAAIGARIEGDCGGIVRTRQRVGGGSFAGGGTSVLRLTFPPPCDVAGQPVALTVTWPSGLVQQVDTTTGAALTIHEPDWRPDPAPPSAPLRLYASPARIVEGLPYDLVAAPTTAGGLPAGATVTVAGPGAVETTLLPDDEGIFSAPGPPAVAGSIDLQLKVDGQPVASPVTMQVHPPVDAAQSLLRLDTPYQVDAAPLEVRGNVRDANGSPVPIIWNDVVVRAGGTALVPVTGTVGGSTFQLDYDTSTLADGTLLEVEVKGVPLGPPRPLHVMGSTAELVDYVDPDHSSCAPSMATAQADGQDIVTFHVFLRDAFDNPLPLPDALPSLQSDALTPPGDPDGTLGSDVMVRARAGTTSGPAEAAVWWYGRQLPMTCRVELSAPGAAPEVSPETSTLTAEPDMLNVAEPDITSLLTFEPRSPAGRLIGSGLDARMTTDLGVFTDDVVYQGLGRYERSFGPGPWEGTAIVQARAAGGSASTQITIAGPAAPAGDASPSATDSGISDAGVSPDASGASPPGSSGCSAGGRGPRGGACPLAVLALLALLGRRRRRA